MTDLLAFVAESNKIEGIIRLPLSWEIAAHERILGLKKVEQTDLVAFVSAVESSAVVRDRAGLDVRVGSHVPPEGGPLVTAQLDAILGNAAGEHLTPYRVHHQYETLHPFTDGNGRSGRALWLWMMHRRGELNRALALGFLHLWYYQSLDGR